MTVWKRLLIAGCITGITAGCTGLHQPGSPFRVAQDPFLSMVDQGIGQLQANIDALTARIAHVSAVPKINDPLMQELRALDLSEWELHRQQWMLQKDHLQYVKHNLRTAHDGQDRKASALLDWRRHQGLYESALEEFRERRHTLERERLGVEGKLIEQRLQ